MIRSTFATALGIAALIVILCGEPASADIIDYSLTKGFTFTTNQQGAVPILTGRYFVHVIDRDKMKHDHTDGQLKGFNPLAQEHVYYTAGENGKGQRINMQNGEGAKAVGIRPKTVGLMQGVTSTTAQAGDATATTKFDVTHRGPGKAEGEMTVSGRAPEDEKKKSGYAFSYGDISAKVSKALNQGIPLSGQVVVNSKLKYRNVQTPFLAGLRQEVHDPLNFIVTDIDGDILLAQTLYTFTADVENGGELTWDNDLLRFDADSSGENARFTIDVTPFSGSPSSLLLEVRNGLVVGANKSGSLFNSLPLPSPGSSGAFEFALPNAFTFDYDLGSFGDQEINAIVEWSGAGSISIEVVPEPSSLALLIAGILGLALYGWRRRRQAV